MRLVVFQEVVRKFLETRRVRMSRARRSVSEKTTLPDPARHIIKGSTGRSLYVFTLNEHLLLQGGSASLSTGPDRALRRTATPLVFIVSTWDDNGTVAFGNGKFLRSSGLRPCREVARLLGAPRLGRFAISFLALHSPQETFPRQPRDNGLLG